MTAIFNNPADLQRTVSKMPYRDLERLCDATASLPTCTIDPEFSREPGKILFLTGEMESAYWISRNKRDASAIGNQQTVIAKGADAPLSDEQNSEIRAAGSASEGEKKGNDSLIISNG